MSMGCQGGYYTITFWARLLTTERKLPIVSSTGYLWALIVGSFIGYLVGAWLADRIGRRVRSDDPTALATRVATRSSKANTSSNSPFHRSGTDCRNDVSVSDPSSVLVNQFESDALSCVTRVDGCTDRHAVKVDFCDSSLQPV